jgi:hypothetical protein
MKDSDIISVCQLCGIKVNGPALKWNRIEVTGALAVHLDNDCSYVHKFSARVSEAAMQWK